MVSRMGKLKAQIIYIALIACCTQTQHNIQLRNIVVVLCEKAKQ